jgi:hypothetical protein
MIKFDDKTDSRRAKRSKNGISQSASRTNNRQNKQKEKKEKASNEFEITNKEKVKEKLLPKIKLFF